MSLPIGLAGFIMMVFLAGAGSNWKAFLNAHAFWIVVGGTTMILLLSNSFAVVKLLLRNVASLFKSSHTLDTFKADLERLARDRSSLQQSDNELIQYALNLWEKGVDPESFNMFLARFKENLENEDLEAVNVLQNLSKYPPALGMMGTVIGLIELFGKLGASNKDALGPALAVAMTATFYGLFLANALIMPITDRLHVEAIHRKKQLNAIYEILILINMREPSSMVVEEIEHRASA